MIAFVFDRHFMSSVLCILKAAVSLPFLGSFVHFSCDYICCYIYHKGHFCSDVG